MRVVGYVRVSTAEQGRSGLGLEAQRQAIRVECERRGLELAAIREEVQSAGRTDNRPVLCELRAELRRGDVLVVAKLDRLTRSLLDFADVLSEAQRRGWTLLVLDQGFDLTTPNGRAMAGMLAVFAQWEREIIGKRIRATMEVKRSNGCPTMVSTEARDRILELHGAGLSQRRIAERLNVEGVAAVGQRWHKETVARIVRAAAD